ncbi:class I adenylate-forming enzyme family protein [Parvularcula oceani]|uniref:class I adenylate-forming enzyme family protein n=1 Tax=Parvularcula oceani TaxID=1247963 RepID=UPI00068FD7A4|nr:class I adenylate-forming enzyme family protein [Parvularcula oceani]
METHREDEAAMRPPAAWPALSLADVRARLCAPGAPFEMETVEIHGVPTRIWKNCPPDLGALTRHARSHGDRPFTIYEDERVSFEAWFRATAHLAAALKEMGVEPGDRVALAMRNLPEWPVVFCAVTSIGAIVVPLNAWWTGEELEYGLRDSGASVLVCDVERWERIAPHKDRLPDLREVLVGRGDGAPGGGASPLEGLIGEPKGYAELPEKALPEVMIDPDQDATIFYTSGTTGAPKGAVGSHRNAVTNILSSAYASAQAALRRGEAPPEPEPKSGLLVIPLFHVTACNARMMGTLFGGHTLVFMHKWDTEKAFAIIEREKISATGGVPAIAWQLLEHPARHKYDLSSLEAVAYGGAPAAPELVRRIKAEFGADPGSGWGMTETSATVTLHGSEDYLNRPDSCGPAVPVADLKIMSLDGSREMPVGETGELWARGPMIVRGYWNKPEATAETFVDGWVRTGDIARLDEEGFCYIVDRAKDVIIRGGENIYSIEVENCLFGHPAVTDAALVGLPHKTLGEEPAAVVHLAPGEAATEEELQAWVKRHLAAFKVPVRIAFCDEPLPRNANGKILKGELRALLLGEDAAKAAAS